METRRKRQREPVAPEDVVLVQVLCVREDGAVLLRKNDEHAGSLAGLWAGLLGPVEDGETLEDAARRIAWPLCLSSLMRVAHFTFLEEDDPVMASEHGASHAAGTRTTF